MRNGEQINANSEWFERRKKIRLELDKLIQMDQNQMDAKARSSSTQYHVIHSNRIDSNPIPFVFSIELSSHRRSTPFNI